MASRYQDELAILQLLHAALSEYGCPYGIVSDNGSVFTANAYTYLLHTLEIEPLYIEKGKPWQNYIEIVFTQMTKRDFFSLEACGNDVAYFDLTINDQNTINQQFN